MADPATPNTKLPTTGGSKYVLYGGIAVTALFVIGGGYAFLKRRGITLSDENLKRLQALGILVSITGTFVSMYYYRETIKAGLVKAETVVENAVAG